MATKSTERIKMLTIMAMLTALAVVADMFLRVKVPPFLTYEPKDVVITIGAFIYHPLAGLAISLVVCLVEMVTISDTGIIGFLMNFLSSAMFVGVASVIYYRKKTILRAVIGLLSGSAAMIAAMLLWNYIMTPIFMGAPREVVVQMMVPLLLPFNAIKAGLRARKPRQRQQTHEHGHCGVCVRAGGGDHDFGTADFCQNSVIVGRYLTINDNVL